MKYHISELADLPLDLRPGDIVFLRGNLGSGKTTLSQELLSWKGIDRNRIKSPTYTYFQKYESGTSGETFYHFDLYRIGEYETFLNIWGEECLSEPRAIKLVEWPEILGNTFVADIEISLAETEDPETREIAVTYRDAARKGGDLA